MERQHVEMEMESSSSSSSTLRTGYDSSQMKKQHMCIIFRHASDSLGYRGAGATAAMDVTAMGCNEACRMVADSVACRLD